MKRFVGLFQGEVDGERFAEPLWAGIWLSEDGETLNVAIDFIANDWITREFFEKIDCSTMEYRDGKLMFDYDGKQVVLEEVGRIDWEELSDYCRSELEVFEKYMEV